MAPAISDEVKDALVKNIRRRMTPQPLKIRADIEMKCFQFDGVLHIKVLTSQYYPTSLQHFPILLQKKLLGQKVLICNGLCRMRCVKLKLLATKIALLRLNLLLLQHMFLPPRLLTR